MSTVPDPMSVRCPHCGADAGQRCMMVSDWARKPHAARRKLALYVAAYADQSLAEHFARSGPCFLHPSLPALHRGVDAIAGMLAAGEDPEVTAEEHGVSMAVVEAVQGWMVKWPGAWE